MQHEGLTSLCVGWRSSVRSCKHFSLRLSLGRSVNEGGEDSVREDRWTECEVYVHSLSYRQLEGKHLDGCLATEAPGGVPSSV